VPAHFGIFGLALLGLVEIAQEENPCQFGDVHHCTGHDATPHHVADGVDRGIDAPLRAEFLGPGLSEAAHHLLERGAVYGCLLVGD